MDNHASFGYWLRRRRRALDLTQEALAQRVGCAVVTISKFERDELRPSRQIAQRLAECLKLPTDEWDTFIKAARRAERILCKVYAKLLAMVLQHWMLVVSCWSYADKSLSKGAAVVRDHAIELASAQGRVERLSEVLTTIQRVLKRTARMNTRCKHPNTYQLLLALTTSDE
jgi:transcriptional regulator with XRE-family HTH domain